MSKKIQILPKKKYKNSTPISGNFTFSSPTTTTPFSIIVTGKQNEEIFKISSDGDVYYRYNGEMTKVECPEDLSQAFQECVLHMSGTNYDDLMIEKFIEKILNHKRSNEYITKLESVFRKLKLEKLNKSI